MEKLQSKTQCIVVKIGSAVMLREDGTLNTEVIHHIAHQVKEIQRANISIILVVSGAVAAGKNIIANGTSIVGKQIYAGVGQALLTATFWNMFNDIDCTLSQFLLTKSHLHTRNTTNLRMALMHTLDHGVIPFINENDAVLPNCFGGNDYLAAKIAHIVGASELIILSNVDGVLLSHAANAEVLHTIDHVTQDVMNLTWSEKSKTGVGGMRTKLVVAKRLSHDKISTIIANGLTKDILTKLVLEQKEIGTKIHHHEHQTIV